MSVAIAPEPDSASQKGTKTVHGLYQGFPLCGFTKEPPIKWPNQDFWTRYDNLAGINCIPCKKKAKELAAGI